MSALRPLSVALLAAGLLALSQVPEAAAWRHPHGGPTNDGFAHVVTAPAGPGAISIAKIGSFAPGAGPVIGIYGLIYIGNEQGKLFAFQPDGTVAWSRQLPPGQAIKASAVVGADRSVYVVGVKSYRDHRVNPAVMRQQSTLHKFTAGGGWIWQTDFPDFYSAYPSTEGRGYPLALPFTSSGVAKPDRWGNLDAA